MVVSATKTEKLYWNDPFATRFTAEGPAPVTASRFGDRASLVLDRTLFYPEAGGQLADLGTLEVRTLDVGTLTYAIDDVQIDDDGTIHHLTRDLESKPLPEGITHVAGAIDASRRRDHMAQHTAQHALSRALLDIAKAETVSSRLGASLCTIDVHLADVPERDLARAEDLVNALVMDDVAVRSLFPTEEELRAMDLRRAPKVATNVRVIEIAGFDLSPCGGTHCTKTGQIGVIRIAGTERYKGKLRISFHAGRRAIDDARKKEQVLAALASELTCGVLDVGAAVGKLRADLKSRSDALSGARGELVELIAERLWSEHPAKADPAPTILPVVRPSDDVGMLRTLAGRLAARADVVAVCVAPAEGVSADHPKIGSNSAPNASSNAASHASSEYAVVLQRGAGATSFDCGAWLKAAAQASGGRGGGRPERAEGRVRLHPDAANPILAALFKASHR